MNNNLSISPLLQEFKSIKEDIIFIITTHLIQKKHMHPDDALNEAKRITAEI